MSAYSEGARYWRIPGPVLCFTAATIFYECLLGRVSAGSEVFCAARAQHWVYLLAWRGWGFLHLLHRSVPGNGIVAKQCQVLRFRSSLLSG